MKKLSTILAIVFFISTIIFSLLFFFTRNDASLNEKTNYYTCETKELANYEIDSITEEYVGSEYLIDLEYIREKALVTSNFELNQLNEKYAKQWEEKALIYSQTITSNFSSESEKEMIANLMKNEQTEWENYYLQQRQFYKTLVENQYTTGSIVSVKLSDHNLKLNRDRALELYYYCCNLMFEVDQP